MHIEARKIVDKYLSTNDVAFTLKPDELELLRKLLYNFTQAQADLIETSVLLAYCSKTLTHEKRFTKDLAKITHRALEMILDRATH